MPGPDEPRESFGKVKVGQAAGAARPSFDDHGWREVDLPHDWVVEGAFDPEGEYSHGFLPTGVGWYRRRFRLPGADQGNQLWVKFDGVFRNSTVWLNGFWLGHHRSGYTSFRYDISDVANYGAENVLSVRVDATEEEGWWYEGAGIYRHVWLVRADRLHVAPDGIFITCSLESQP